jgi:DNA-directed RNA polymerase specialized sigma24 family protein
MDRYADGEDAAFAEVYDLLAPMLLGFFARQSGDSVLAEDLAQQTLLQMHAARRNYATGSDVVPWAFAIGRNVLIDARRRTRKEVLFPTAEDDAAALDLGVDRSSIPDDLAESRQMADRVARGSSPASRIELCAYTISPRVASVRGWTSTPPSAITTSSWRALASLPLKRTTTELRPLRATA